MASFSESLQDVWNILTRIVAPNWLKVLAWVYLGRLIAGGVCILILKADQISVWFDRYRLKKYKE
ncbi:hypothetical protein AMR76_05635 [Vibrio furnissii]|uniref:Uncharacterized protein n=1 Tax=Vibrio furnissii TaxID=29494 RepID=A0A0Q2V329_VIBFU|nr:hypothetical protein AMR76_05635 [Vibrio furnissii]